MRWLLAPLLCCLVLCSPAWGQEGEKTVEEMADCFVMDGVVTVFVPWIEETRKVSERRVFPGIPFEALPTEYFEQILTEVYPDWEAERSGDENADSYGWDWVLEKEDEKKTVKFYTENGEVVVEGYPLQIRVSEDLRGKDTCMVCVRPEHINLTRAGGESGGMPGKLTAISFLGQTVRERVATPDGTELLVDVATSEWLAKGLSVGDEVAWTPKPDSAMVFSLDDDHDVPEEV